MQYSNFVMLNNVHASLSIAVWSVATTIQLTSWQWSRFWTVFPQIATLESFEEWKVTKREIVKITARNGDNLTVVRAFAPCPENDDANTQSQSSFSFQADDTISLLIPKEIFDKIHDAINDIYDNWTNKLRTEVVSWLQIQVNAWPVLVWSAYYNFAGDTITLTDNATNYVEIDEDWTLVANTTWRTDDNTKIAMVVTSSWSVTSIADRRLWTIGWKIGWLNIHELTEKTNVDPDDEFILSDSENIWNNKKASLKNIYWKAQWIAGSNISKGDIVSLTDLSESNSSAVYIWNTVPSMAIKVYWNGWSSDTISAYLGIVWSWQNIEVRIETDDNWKPSWTLVHNDATATVPTSSLSTTVALIDITFASAIELAKDQRYWVKFSCASLDASNHSFVWSWTNYGAENIMTSDWSNRSRYVWTETSSITINTTAGWSLFSWYSFNINPKINFKMLSFTWARMNSLTIKQGATVLYSGVPWDVNVDMKSGSVYNVSIDCANQNERRIEQFPWCTSQYFYLSSDWNTKFPRYSWSTKTVVIEFGENSYIKASNIRLIVINWTPTNMNSLSDEMWIATEDQTEWNVIKYATKWWIVENSSWNLIPWQSYVFKWWMVPASSSIAPTDNYIFMWIALSKTQLKVDLKLHCFVQDSVTRILTFSWILTCANGWAVAINWWSYVTYYWVPVLKWNSLVLWNTTYWFYVDKNR